MLKINLTLLILTTFLLLGCNTERAEFAVEQLDDIIADNEYWIKSLKKFDPNDPNAQSELKYQYTRSSSTTNSVYHRVISLKMGSGVTIDDNWAIKYNRLLDERDNFVRAFYYCDDITIDEVEELIKLETKIVAALKELRRQLTNS